MDDAAVKRDLGTYLLFYGFLRQNIFIETDNQLENSNDPNRIIRWIMWHAATVLVIGTFVFRICFGFRASDF
jgi:hypothetical protein